MAQSPSRPPPGSIDCHVHVFDEPRFPFAADRSYTPGKATTADLQAHLAKLAIDRAVLVQPSVYGTDNRCLVDALASLGKARARGVAVIDAATVKDDELSSLKQAGVSGVRVNLTVRGEERAAAAVAAVSQAVARIAPFNLVVQAYVDLALAEALEPIIAQSPVPIVLDHFAGAKAEAGISQKGFESLLRMLRSGKVWVKLSAPYRASTAGPGYTDLDPIVKAMIGANPDRLVWASDWPHTGGGAERQGRKATDIEPFREVDDVSVLSLLARWSPDEGLHKKVLVTNPERLFGF